MNFDVYCDESRPDALSADEPSAHFLVIGSLWLPSEDRDALKAAIHELRDKHRVGGEFKWNKVSPSRLAFYEDLASLFFGGGDRLRFRCIAVDERKLDLVKYHDGDQELGFYKFYYQLLLHWILDFNSYSIFCDYKSNRDRQRLKVLGNCLGNADLSATIERVQSVRSDEAVLVQLTDVLTGIASARMNESLTPRLGKIEAGRIRGEPPRSRRRPDAQSRAEVQSLQDQPGRWLVNGYPPLLKLADEAAYRLHFETTYCQVPIATFDGIQVRFRKRDFDHCCFESSNRDGFKDAFSTARAERLDWIKAALQDAAAELYVGWDNKKKTYDYGRVCVVCGNYVVIFRLIGPNLAQFVTAYVADTPRTLDRIRKLSRNGNDAAAGKKKAQIRQAGSAEAFVGSTTAGSERRNNAPRRPNGNDFVKNFSKSSARDLP